MNKIVILTSVHSAFDVRIFHKQARSLVKAGYNVVLIVQHDRNETVDGVEIIGLSKPRDRFQRIFGLTFRVLHLALKEKADVYHFHDPELIPVGLFLKFLGAKVIYDVHEDYPASIKESEWLPRFIRSITASVFNIFEKTAYRFFDVVIAATNSISRRFLSGEISTLHNYPISQYANAKADPSSFHEGNTVIYIGGLSRLRGIVEIIKSLEYIDEKLRVKIKLLGQFSEPEFEKEVRSMEMFSRATLGYVPHEELNSHLCAARVGLVLLHPAPNYIRSMPTKLFEYMSAGLPVIASNFPLWKHLVEGNNCGLTIDPSDPEEIAKAIEYLLRRPELMEKMGENGRKAVSEKYNWEHETEELFDLYGKLLRKRAKRRQKPENGGPTKMSNIWIFNHYAEPPGGLFSNPYDMGKQLTKRGHSVSIFASSFSHYKMRETGIRKKKAVVRKRVYDNVNFYFVKTFPYSGNSWKRILNMLSYGWSVLRVSRKLDEKPDIILASCPHLFGAFVGLIVSIIKGSRFFFEVRDLWPQTLIDSGALSYNNPIAMILRLIERILYAKAEKITTVMPFANEYITQFGIPESKIFWIPNGVDTSRYNGSKSYDGKYNGRFVFMYAGGFAKYHNIHIILKAANIVKDRGEIEFVLIGDGPEKSRLMKVAEEMSLANIEFRDSVPKLEIPGVLEEASGFIYVVKDLPVLKYGISPNKLYDYMAANRPVIFSSCSRNNPILEANAGITVTPNDPEALAEAVIELVNLSAEDRLRMANNGSEYVKNSNDIEILANKLEALFDV